MCFGKKPSGDTKGTAVNTRATPIATSPPRASAPAPAISKAPKVASTDKDIIQEAAALRTFIEQHVFNFYAPADVDEATRSKHRHKIALTVAQLANYPANIHQGLNYCVAPNARTNSRIGMIATLMDQIEPPSQQYRETKERLEHLRSLFRMSTALAEMFASQGQEWDFNIPEMKASGGSIVFPALRKDGLVVRECDRAR